MTDAGDKVLEALQEKPFLYYEVLVRSRDVPVLGSWERAGPEWVRLETDGSTRAQVLHLDEMWSYRVLGGSGWVGGFESDVVARRECDRELGLSGWLLS